MNLVLDRPEDQSEQFEPDFRFDEFEVEFAEEEFDLGIDHAMARKMRDIILDETIELAPSNRSPRLNRNWTKEDVIEYGHWLSKLLAADDNVEPLPLKVSHIDRASKLNIGPSLFVLVRTLGQNCLTTLNLEVGELSPKYKFKNSTDEWMVSEGKKFADDIDKRPSHAEIRNARNDGLLPGPSTLIERFGSMRAFFELIGRPSFEGADEFDLLDWGVAFLRQNGPDIRITTTIIDNLAKKGRGPSRRFVYDCFPTMVNFNERVQTEYWKQIKEEEEALDSQNDAIEELKVKDNAFAVAIQDVSEDKTLRFAANYRMAKHKLPGYSDAKIILFAKCKTGDNLANAIMREKEITLAEIEMEAEDMKVFDTLWPGYRFQNANLRIEEQTRQQG